MLLFSILLAATGVSSFNFTNSTVSTYHNTTSTSVPATRPPLPINSQVLPYHNITSVASLTTATPLSTAAGVSSQTTINNTEQSCDTTSQECSPVENPTYSNPYYNTSFINPNDNQTLRDICANAFEVSLSSWLSTSSTTQVTEHPVTTKAPSIKGPPLVSKVGGNSTALASKTHVQRNEDAISSTTQPQLTTSFVSYTPKFPFTASQPCCYNCTIYGGPLQLFQWPAQTASPPTSTYVNNLNFTL